MKRRLTPCPPPTWVLPEQLWKPLHWPQKHLTSEKKKRQLCEVNTQHGTEQGTQSKCLTVLDRLLCIASTHCIASFTDFWRSLIASWRSPCSVHLCWTILIGCFFGIFHHWTITTLIKGILGTQGLLQVGTSELSAILETVWVLASSFTNSSRKVLSQSSTSRKQKNLRSVTTNPANLLPFPRAAAQVPASCKLSFNDFGFSCDLCPMSPECLQNVYRMCLKLWT